MILIDLVYQCATDPGRWPVFLDQLTGATNSRGATFMLHDLAASRGASIWQHGFDPEVIAQYPGWADQNTYFVEGGHRLSTGVVARGEDAVADERVIRTAFFNEYLRKADTLHHVAACIFREEAIVALLLAQKAINQSSHSAAEKRLMEAVLPHVQRTVAIQRRIDGIDLGRAAAFDALDRLSIGICLLDRLGRAIVVNRAARSIFDQNDGLTLGAAGVRADNPQAGSTLHAIITRACRVATTQDEPTGDLTLVPRRSGRRAFTVLVSPLRLQLFELANQPPAAILLVADPEQRAEGVEEALVRLYKLTPMESRVARMLLDGESVESIAGSLGVTGNTARTHLKRVFSKTGTRGQADLMRLILGWAGRVTLGPTSSVRR
ncbi:helix-turn-helix transcriptional regulator [Candidatus Binatia bacterium]|nr:helix-turn-helix transcriptional regulator [Microbacteriaceae bacterium]MBY0280449.1 helix-turn-helix transcriptional regulator [Candidatus Binatia bacterium]